jgi:hypothetical protein
VVATDVARQVARSVASRKFPSKRCATIWRRWAEAKAHLAGAGIALADIAAEAVASAQASSAALGARYLLELGTEA